VAKAGRKHTATAQRSKRRSPNRQTVVHTTSNPRFWELGSRDELEALESRRERKERAYDLIATRHDKTPLQKRRWDKLLDIAAEYARTPGTTEIDNEKRDQMVDFLYRAIYRGEIKDDKGRMRVLYLDPSPLASKRLDLNNRLSLNDFRKLFKIDYLLIRRKECIACFSRNNVEFPKAWLPSELTGPNVPNTGSLPAQTIVVADQAAPKTNLVRWLENEVSQLKAAGKLPDRITDCAKSLETRLSTAADSDKSLRRVGTRHIENTLRTCGLFPKRRSK